MIGPADRVTEAAEAGRLRAERDAARADYDDLREHHLIPALNQLDALRGDLARVTGERDAAARRTDNLLGEIRLYVKWRWVTSQLTTEQKEAWADAVDRWSARLNADDPGEPNPVDRWWRLGVAALGGTEVTDGG